MANDRYENQLLAEKLIFQILSRYEQKIVFDPAQIDELKPAEKEWLRQVWQGKNIPLMEEKNKEIEKLTDEDLSEKFQNLKVIAGKIQ